MNKEIETKIRTETGLDGEVVGFAYSKGRFYQLVDSQTGAWKQLECYLPDGEGTYKEPLEITRDKFLDRLFSGGIIIRRALGSKGSYLNTKWTLKGDDFISVADFSWTKQSNRSEYGA